MDIDSDEHKAKRLLVDLEDEHERLQLSVEHLRREVEKREVEVKILLSQRELERLTRENNKTNNATECFQPQPKLMKSQSVDFKKVKPGAGGDTIVKHSSEFVRQLDLILNRVSTTTEELLTLIEL